MHYFQHHIGDFRSGCFNMTRMERALYREMLDIYYDTESPLPSAIDEVCKLLGVRDASEKTLVGEVLSLKFKQVEGRGWVHERCETEIARYHSLLDSASKAGKASAASRLNKKATKVQQETNESSTTVKQELNSTSTNQEPRTKNHNNSPIPPAGGKEPAKRKKRETCQLETYLSECKAIGVKPIPDDDAVFDYANEAGISNKVLALHWSEFRARYSLPDSKKYKSWRAVFNKSVRGNWFRLWYFDSNGECVLTTTGLQAKNIADAAKRKQQ